MMIVTEINIHRVFVPDHMPSVVVLLSHQCSDQATVTDDEIDAFLSGRMLTASEAVWRILGLRLHKSIHPFAVWTFIYRTISLLVRSNIGCPRHNCGSRADIQHAARVVCIECSETPQHGNIFTLKFQKTTFGKTILGLQDLDLTVSL